MTPLLSLSLDATAEAVAAAGYAPIHARRLRRVVLGGNAPEADAALPGGLIERLRARLSWTSARVEVAAPAGDGSTKLLLRLADGASIEAVRLPGSGGGAPSVCVSTQVGCAMACRFCASGLDQVQRQVAAHEILEQVALARALGPVRRVVLMGSGEPTQNLGAVATALAVLRDEAEIGPRHVIVSTVGPPGAIDRLAALGLRVTLAVSLHATTRALRGALIPAQAHVDPADLLAAADRFAAQSGRPYQVEIVLLGGVNDGPAEAASFAVLLAGRRAHVSAIGWNPVPGLPFEPPSAARVTTFIATLRAAGVSAQLRRTVGGSATAACGQLRLGAPHRVRSNQVIS